MQNSFGIFELACAEATRPWFFHIRSMEEAIPEKFLACLAGDVIRFPSHDGRHEMCFGVRREFPDWCMPEGTQNQMNHSIKFWGNEYFDHNGNRVQ